MPVCILPDINCFNSVQDYMSTTPYKVSKKNFSVYSVHYSSNPASRKEDTTISAMSYVSTQVAQPVTHFYFSGESFIVFQQYQ